MPYIDREYQKSASSCTRTSASTSAPFLTVKATASVATSALR
jgi:hypothetical protein